MKRFCQSCAEVEIRTELQPGEEVCLLCRQARSAVEKPGRGPRLTSLAGAVIVLTMLISTPFLFSLGHLLQ